MTLVRLSGKTLTVSVVVLAAFFGGAGSALLGVCGPFTDVSDATFCPFVLEIFTLGITTGTTPTTYDPAGTVSRLQMAAFLSRTVDGVLKRGGRRAALNQFWTTEVNASLAVTTVSPSPRLLVSDGEDIWVGSGATTVSRVHASDGKLLETWTGATMPAGILSAMGRIFAAGLTSPSGNLYRIDPSQPAGAVTTVAKLDAAGAILQTVTVGSNPQLPLFDGSNIWVPNVTANSVSVVRASNGAVLATLTGNGLNGPLAAAFDGQRILVTNAGAGADSVSLWKAADLSALGTFGVGTGSSPFGACSDGINFWITLNAAGQLARF